ncbi:MAG: Uma2 family endonuclease [Chloroflexaceae bacterium]|nr:Uma2 family endonuclease [Chloroflexaceae bacterium]
MTPTTTWVEPPQVECDYPEADGEPMAESDFQRKPLTYAVEALDLHFQHRPDVYVSGNMFIYYEVGQPGAVVAPDVFVVFGVSKHDRRTFKVWEEGKGPDVVIEITSRQTHREDENRKPTTYRCLKVQEYFQYDPTGDYLRPALKGRRLTSWGGYQAIAARPLPGGNLFLESQVLGLHLRLEAGRLRLFDPTKNTYLLTYQEEARARQEAETRARAALLTHQEEARARQEAETRARAAEARLRELEAELQRLRGPAEEM